MLAKLAACAYFPPQAYADCPCRNESSAKQSRERTSVTGRHVKAVRPRMADREERLELFLHSAAALFAERGKLTVYLNVNR
jgi:hypothetical protein